VHEFTHLNQCRIPDLEIRGGAGHPDLEIRKRGGGAVSQKIFSALWASVWSKDKGGPPVPRAPPQDLPL